MEFVEDETVDMFNGGSTVVAERGRRIHSIGTLPHYILQREGSLIFRLHSQCKRPVAVIALLLLLYFLRLFVCRCGLCAVMVKGNCLKNAKVNELSSNRHFRKHGQFILWITT